MSKKWTMSKDTIYREDAIIALRLEYPMMPMFKSLREEWAIKTEGFRKAEEVIMKLPSADRPQGQWIDMGGYEVCKNCHEIKRFPHWNFCPVCGAWIKGADDV